MALTEWGAKTADINFEKLAFSCGGKHVLNAIAATVEASAATPSMTLDTEAALLDTNMGAACAACAALAQPATTPATTVVPGTTISIPGYCTALHTPPNWQLESPTREPANDTQGACCYKERYVFLVSCSRSDWNWYLCLGLVTYQRIECYSFYNYFCCGNNNQQDCSDHPTCTHVPPATLPPTGTTPTGPKRYYNPE